MRKNVPEKPDILIFMSDQHDGRCLSFLGDPVVETPHLDEIAAAGTSFANAYSPCPLCVPARMSFLTGQLPHHTGVFTNHGSIHPEMPTFLHSLALGSYETVLCGRMHFEGADQRHGFQKRIAGDITPTQIGTEQAFLEQYAPCSPLLTDAGCLQAVGSGTSVTLEYDRYVVRQALSYLASPHEMPQCILVGTYGPHFPYVAPEMQYAKYQNRVSLPPNLYEPDASYTKDKICDRSEDLILAVRAAYAGMIAFEDDCVGQVHAAWQDYLRTAGRPGLFLYLSDHGEQAGERGLYGKQTLFEPSVRIPMLFCGAGIPKGVRVDTPVSLIDICPTLIELTQSPTLQVQDGRSLTAALRAQTEENPRDNDLSANPLQAAANRERSVLSQEMQEPLPEAPVIAEWIDAPYRFGTHYGRMIRKGKWKLVHFPDFPEEDLLTCPQEDPWEMHNLAGTFPEIAASLREEAFRGIDPQEIVARKNRHSREIQLLEQFAALQGWTSEETWEGNDACRQLPRSYAHTSRPLPEKFRPYWESQEKQRPGD